MSNFSQTPLSASKGPSKAFTFTDIGMSSLDLKKLKSNPNRATTDREHSPKDDFRMTMTQRFLSKAGSPKKTQTSTELKKESSRPKTPINIKLQPLSPKIAIPSPSLSLSSRVRTPQQAEKDSNSEGSPNLYVSPKQTIKISKPVSHQDFTIQEKNEVFEKTNRPKITIKKVPTEEKKVMRFGITRRKQSFLSSMRLNDDKLKPQVKTKRLSVNSDTTSFIRRVSIILTSPEGLENRNLLAPPGPSFTEKELDNQQNTEDDEGAHCSSSCSTLSDKDSVDDLDGILNAERNEEKISTPLLTVENSLQKRLSKRFAFSDTISVNSASESSDSEHCFTGTPESQSKIKHSPVKNFNGKIMKPSGFAVDTFSKRVEALDGKTNRPKSQTHFDVFTDNRGTDFFDVNKDNILVGPNSCLDVGNIIKSSRAKLGKYQPEDGAAAPMVISYLDDPKSLTIQPKFMQTHGSMCFTELWSGRNKTEYLTKRNEEKKVTKKVVLTPAESLYRPNKDIQKKIVQARMQANRAESGVLSDRSSEACRLPTISERSPVHVKFGGETPLRGVKDAPEMKSMKSLFSIYV